MAKLGWQWWIFGQVQAQFAVAAAVGLGSLRYRQACLDMRQPVVGVAAKTRRGEGSWRNATSAAHLGYEQLGLAGQLVLGTPADGVNPAGVAASR